MKLDHVVLWTADPLAAVDFYQRVVGLTPVRADEFRAGTVPFPSMRVSDESILDLMTRLAAPFTDAMAGAPGSSGHPVNHVCLCMSEAEWAALRERLTAAGIAMKDMARSFGAQGLAPRAFYFADPDGNVIEARYY